MGRVALDTSVLIALTEASDSRHTTVLEYLRQREDIYIISSVTLAEALVKPFQIGSEATALKKIMNFVESVIAVDAELAFQAAGIRSEKRLKMPDSIISATALREKATLVTFDQQLAKAHPGSVLLS